MLTSKELQMKMKECLSDIDFFTTAQLKEMLNNSGCVYNVDYKITAFSNAVASLVKQEFIAPRKQDKRGTYQVIHSSQEKTHQIIIKEQKENILENVHDTEMELDEMRNDIKDCLKTYYTTLEQKLDSEKPSKYGRNPKTYADILELIKYMKNFKFTVEL